MPKLTVVCCFFNRKRGVRRTLESLAQQTFTDFEVIVIDDGSSDGTAYEIERMVHKLSDRRFQIDYLSTNIGLTRCLVKAISRSSAEYIGIQDAGDVSLPLRLARQVKLLDMDRGVAVAGCHYVNYIPDQSFIRVRCPNAGTATLKTMLRDTTFTHGEVVFRRQVYDLVGGYRAEFRFAQDSDLWLRMAKVARFATVPEILYHRYIELDGISYRPSTFAEQSAYYVCGRMAALDAQFEAWALGKLRQGAAIFDVLPLKTPAIQRLIIRGVLRLLLYGSPEQARALAHSFVTSSHLRMALQGAAKMSYGALGCCILKVLRVKLGIRTCHLDRYTVKPC